MGAIRLLELPLKGLIFRCVSWTFRPGSENCHDHLLVLDGETCQKRHACYAAPVARVSVLACTEIPQSPGISCDATISK